MTPNFALYNALWNIVLCSVSAYLLRQIWQVIVVKKDTPEDKGGLYLSYSLVFWIVEGLLTVLYLALNARQWPAGELLFSLIRSLLSTWNSVFILFALHYFDLIPDWLEKFVKHPEWKNWVKRAGIVVSLLTVFVAGILALRSWSASGQEVNYKFIYAWDFVFSTLTSIFLLISIHFTFQKHAFKRLAWVGFFLIGIILLAQGVDIGKDLFLFLGPDWHSFVNSFLLVTYKSLLLIVFTLIMLSWAMRSPTVEIEVPRPDEATICARYNITPVDIELLRRLARGENRDAIAEELFQKTSGAKRVDARQKELADKFGVPNDVVRVLMFALRNQIIDTQSL